MATIVGYPLTPELLNQIGAFNFVPPLDPGFAPDGSWTHTYRILTCGGYLDKKNDFNGTLQVERVAGAPNDPFTLNIDQKVDNKNGILSTISAQVQCLSDQLASPFQWHLLSRSIEDGVDLVPDVRIEEDATVNGSSIDVIRDSVPLTRPGSTQLTADWCLFEAVQRLAFQSGPPITFDTLEGLSCLKNDQSLTYRGTHSMQMGAETLTLHWFHQLGNGVLPYEFWLDENHRLLIVTTLSRAYILVPPTTPNAPETIVETFGSDPTTAGWVNGSAGSTTFSYNAGGWLDANIFRDSANRALYTKALATRRDKTEEFWWEMDVEMVSSADNIQQCMFGVFDSSLADNHHNAVADRFFYIETSSGTPKGNRHDIIGYDSEGTEARDGGSPITPGLPFGVAVRVKGHYWYESVTDEGRAIVAVYEINPDGSTGSKLMTSDMEIVVAMGKILSFDSFGLGNRTDGGLRDGQTVKVDNLYFSNVGENPAPTLPSFYSP